MSASVPDDEARNDALTDLVEDFLSRREGEPGLDAESFARTHSTAGPRLLPALREALDVMAALDADVEPTPRWIGDHRVVRELGRGGMGIVFEVERDGARLALKRLSAAALLQPNARARLQREALALQRIRHPGVVTVHEVGEIDAIPHLVMDLVAGRSLADLGRVPWRTAADLGRHIATALAAVHAAGLFHRDLKPQNVVLADDGRPVLIDFGLVHDTAAVTLTGTGDLLGTPRYLAPEQATGAPIDARTDVFALGLVLAELLTGAPARTGDDRTSLLVEARRGARPHLPATVPPGLRHVLHRALARRPQDRIQTAAAFAAELDRVCAGLPARSRAPGPIVRTRDWLLFHPRPAGALAVLALGAVAAIVIAIAANREAARADATRRHFGDAVVAYLASDRDGQARATSATLALSPGHVGSTCLQVLADDTATTPDAQLPEPLRTALAHRHAGRWAEAAAALEQQGRVEPESPLLYVLLAEAHGRIGNRDAAVADLVAAARLLPASAAVSAALGAARLAARDAPSAIADYRRAVELDPGSWHRRLSLARALYSVDAEAGLREIDVARELLGDERPVNWLDLLNLQAALCDKLGRSEQAVPLFREIVALAPDNARFAYNLGYALDRALQVEEARTWYERALQLDPGNQPASLCLVWLLATAAPPLADLDRSESLLIDTLLRDQGRSDAVLQMVREFGLRTGRIARLTAQLDRLAADDDVPTHRRATLQHTRAFLDNAAPSDRR